ncbi:MAG: 2-hydroxychromene-2-carboxylate isomerase [Deltaproteobacteria bacterium]|nr:2-hydroxychromene-2-carboxylate isomerase [Deltaproteobacteria bacterium]
MTEPPRPVEFWFEFASTYSYPAAMRIEERARALRVPLRWKAFLLGPIFAAQGWSDSPFNLYPAKGRYMWRDLERVCAGLGLPLRRPTRFPRNGLRAARVACWFEDEPWLPAFVRAVYDASFARDLEIAESEVVAACLERAGAPAGALAAGSADAAKAKLRARGEQAAALGLFGAPSFVVGAELFWGNDRLEAALAWARGHGA